MEIDPKKLTPSQSYDLMTSIIIPRPIALVSTLSPEGIPNAAPFSFFTGISTTPPLVGIAIAFRGSEKKGTLLNITIGKEFVINIVDEKLSNGMIRSAETYPPGTDKFEAAGLTPLPSVRISPPRVGEAPVSLECRLDKVVELAEASVDLIIGRVEYVHLFDRLWCEGSVEPEQLRAIGRLGQSNYCTTHEPFQI